MKEPALQIEQGPFYLQFTYSLCLHAAALSLLITLPVFGTGGRAPAGEYAVTLAGPENQPFPADTLKKKDELHATGPGSVEQADPEPIGKDARPGKSDDAGKDRGPEDAGVLTASSEGLLPGITVQPAVEKPAPPVIPLHIATPPEKETLQAAAGGPPRADISAEPGAGRKAENVVGSEAVHQTGLARNARIAAAEQGSGPRSFGLLSGSGARGGQSAPGRTQGLLANGVVEKKGLEAAGGEQPIAVYIPEALLSGDIRIEVAGKMSLLSVISMGLGIRQHPSNRKKQSGDMERKIEEAETKLRKGDTEASAIKYLAVKKAEKGVYIFSLANAGAATSVSITFRFHGGYDQERTKEYAAVTLSPNDIRKFIFLMPERLFWDDTGSFSGSIEDSRSITRFRNDTGLLWKEEKE